jgi:hypothetical protein
MYEIAQDIDAIRRLVDEAVDEDSGEVKPISDDDKKTMSDWLDESQTAFETKFDNICRFNRNLKHDSELADAARNSFKSELDRLAKRAKVAEAKADRVKNLIWFAFDKLGWKKYKTALFSAGIQKTQHSVKESSTFDVAKIPDKFLKKELSASAIKDAVKAGELYTKNDNPLSSVQLFYKDGAEEKHLEGVFYSQGETLVIR